MQLGCVPQLVSAQVMDFGLFTVLIVLSALSLKSRISRTFPLCTPPSQPRHLPDVCYWSETSSKYSVWLSMSHLVTGFQLQTCARWMEGRTLSRLVIQSFNKHGDSAMCWCRRLPLCASWVWGRVLHPLPCSGGGS